MIKIKPLTKGKINIKPVTEQQEINIEPSTVVINENYTKSEVDQMIKNATQFYIDILEDNIEGEFVFPDDVTHIGYVGFCGHKKVTKIVCHDNMTFDATGSNFRWNNALKEFVFPNNPNFKSIMNYCFASSTGIETLDGFVFPEPITTVGQYAFASCTALKDAHLPTNIITLGNYCFGSDTALQEVSGEGVKTIGEHIFNGCTHLTSVDFPNLENLGSYAFNGCTALHDVSFPKLKTIATNAFRGSKVTSVVLPDTLTTTQLNTTFYGIDTLKWVDIPKSVNKFVGNEFIGCAALQYIIVRNPTPPSLANSTFRSVKTGGKIYVPKGSKAAYEATRWNNSTANYYPKKYGWTIEELDEDGNIPTE